MEQLHFIRMHHAYIQAAADVDTRLTTSGTLAVYPEPGREISPILIEKIVHVEEIKQSTSQQDQALRPSPPTDSGTRLNDRRGPRTLHDYNDSNPTLRTTMYDPRLKRGTVIGVAHYKKTEWTPIERGRRNGYDMKGTAATMTSLKWSYCS